MGVRNIIAVDGDEKRLAMAKRLGAAYTVNAGAPDATEQVKAITGGLGAEMLFQCTGSPKAASKAWSYVRRGGSYCELGFFVNNGDTTYNPHLDLCNKEVKVIGSWTYQAQDWIQSFSFLKEAQDRGLPITDLLTHKYPLDKMNEAMEMNISMEGLKIAFVAED
jgi:L-iditol 2-dehydrogenase